MPPRTAKTITRTGTSTARGEREGGRRAGGQAGRQVGGAMQVTGGASKCLPSAACGKSITKVFGWVWPATGAPARSRQAIPTPTTRHMQTRLDRGRLLRAPRVCRLSPANLSTIPVNQSRSLNLLAQSRPASHTCCRCQRLRPIHFISSLSSRSTQKNPCLRSRAAGDRYVLEQTPTSSRFERGGMLTRRPGGPGRRG